MVIKLLFEAVKFIEYQELAFLLHGQENKN